MADNVLVDNGTGTDYTVASDEVAVNGGSTGQVQYVKLVDGTNGGTTGLSGDAQGLHIVARRDAKRIAVDSGGLTIATTAYTAGDQVGTQFTLTDAARVTGGTGLITSVVLTSAADTIGAYDVVICRNSITLAADNTAFAISDADAKHVIAVVQLSQALDIGNNRVAQALNLAIPYDTGSDANLYAALITRAGHTFFAAVTDLQLQVFVERN